MPSLHLTWTRSGASDGRLQVWAEGDSRSKPKPGEHPHAVDPATLDPSLAAAERTTLSLWLPSSSRGPQVSERVGDAPRGRPAKLRLARWRVPSRALTPLEAVAWLLAQPSDANGELRCFQATANLLLEALAGQRFVPGLVGDEARWRLQLADDALAVQLAALARALPPACRAACDDPERAPSARRGRG